MLNQPRIIMSFCIPTYNRAHCIKRCIDWILEYPGNDIEIIVSDNGSTDDTELVVSQIDDSRLKYFRNEKNRGVQYNIKRVCDEASGEFCFLLSDEDQVNIDAIPKIIDIISKNPEIALIYGVVAAKEVGGNTWTTDRERRLEKGYEAISQIAFKHAYLSGIIFKRSMYVAINKVDDLWYQQDIFYPHEYLAFKLALMGQAQLTKEIILFSHDYKNKTFTGTSASNSAYSFESRCITFKQRADIIRNNLTDKALIQELMVYNYRNMIYNATVNFFYLTRNPDGRKLMNLDYHNLSLSNLVSEFYTQAVNYIKNSELVINKDFYNEITKITLWLRIKIIFIGLYKTRLYYLIKNITNRQ